MLKIGDKTFLNLQEAVGWLMENNCIPFQCTAPYAANTEIGMGTIVNPSPAKVRIGSIIFFSDSKVSTVTGITQNGFMVSDEYNDLVDDVVYVKNVAIAGNGHLIVTLSNDDAIDAGLIKQVSGFSIDGLQHLIVSYNDGTTQDLGAIFNGNIVINGNLEVTGRANLPSLTSPNNYIEAEKPVVEVMDGYEYAGTPQYVSFSNLNMLYAGVVKNGNKLTFSLFFKITRQSGENYGSICRFKIPPAIYNKLVSNYLDTYDILDIKNVSAFDRVETSVSVPIRIVKRNDGTLGPSIMFYISIGSMLEVGTEYLIRIEETFLLSDNLAA